MFSFIRSVYACMSGAKRDVVRVRSSIKFMDDFEGVRVQYHQLPVVRLRASCECNGYNLYCSLSVVLVKFYSI